MQPVADEASFVTRAWRGVQQSPLATDAREAATFRTFLIRERRDVVQLFAMSRRLAVAESVRYSALDLFYRLATRRANELSGPRARMLCVSSCISLASKLDTMDPPLVGDDERVIAHKIRHCEIRDMESRVLAASEMRVGIPAWWCLVDALLDTRVAMLAASTVSFDAIQEPTSRRGAPSPDPALRKAIHRLPVGRRNSEAVMRTVGMCFDQMILAIGFGSATVDTQQTQVLGTPLSRAADADVAKFGLLLLGDPCAVAAVVVCTNFGLVADDLCDLLPPAESPAIAERIEDLSADVLAALRRVDTDSRRT